MLNESQKSLLKVVADNPALTEALKEVFNGLFSLEAIKTDVPNTELGEVVRARLEGARLVALAFREIATHKTFNPGRDTEKNPAR